MQRDLEEIMERIRAHIIRNTERKNHITESHSGVLSIHKDSQASGTGSGFRAAVKNIDLTKWFNIMYNKYSEVRHMAKKSKKEEEVLVEDEEIEEDEDVDEDEIGEEYDDEGIDEEDEEDEEDEDSEEESEDDDEESEDEEDEEEFQVSEGDVVCLKSGGPSMTVESVWQDPPDRVTCRWFDEAANLQKADFKISGLSFPTD